MPKRVKKRVRIVDEDVPVRIRNIEDELPKPIGIYGENIYHSVFIGNTFVGIPTPIHIKGDKNIFWNNRAYLPKRR